MYRLFAIVRWLSVAIFFSSAAQGVSVKEYYRVSNRCFTNELGVVTRLFRYTMPHVSEADLFVLDARAVGTSLSRLRYRWVLTPGQDKELPWGYNARFEIAHGKLHFCSEGKEKSLCIDSSEKVPLITGKINAVYDADGNLLDDRSTMDQFQLLNLDAPDTMTFKNISTGGPIAFTASSIELKDCLRLALERLQD